MTVFSKQFAIYFCFNFHFIQSDPIIYPKCSHHIDGLVQDCSNSSALAMELLQSCTKTSMHFLADPWRQCVWVVLCYLKVWSVFLFLFEILKAIHIMVWCMFCYNIQLYRAFQFITVTLVSSMASQITDSSTICSTACSGLWHTKKLHITGPLRSHLQIPLTKHFLCTVLS